MPRTGRPPLLRLPRAPLGLPAASLALAVAPLAATVPSTASAVSTPAATTVTIDGSESSRMRTPTTVNCTTGDEWWMMKQAKERSPDIKLAALSWGAPGRVGGGEFWSTGTVGYLTSRLGCARQQGLTVDYLGGWNENAYGIGWFKELRTALDASGNARVRTVVSDDRGVGA